MKNPGEQRRRWLEQAEHQLEVTDALLEGGFWSDVCFMAEQTAQLALKAFLFGEGRRFLPIHSIYELASECARIDRAFEGAKEWGRTLDRYYITTRYPDALAPPAVPFRSFTTIEANLAHSHARDIVALVKGRAEG